jgi:hypothetical protein
LARVAAQAALEEGEPALRGMLDGLRGNQDLCV